MRLKQLHIYLSLLVVHICISLYAFHDFFAHTRETLFCKWADGMRNYFIMQRFVSSPGRFDSFNYPYGEHVIYTDAIPLFSVPFKWFCHHVHDISAFTIPAVNLLLIGNVLLAGLLGYFIFHYILRHKGLAFFMAVILPWANPQLMRIWKGHFSLSFSSVILLGICALILWNKYRESNRKRTWLSIAIILLSIASFFIQPYYLAILSVFIFGGLLSYGWLQRKQQYGKRTMLAAVAIPAISIFICYLLVFLTDPQFSSRFDHVQVERSTKTIFSSLHTAYLFYNIYFPLKYELLAQVEDPDKLTYLGNIALFTFSIIGIIAIIKKSFRQQVITIQKHFFGNPLHAALLFGGGLCLMVSFGELYVTGEQGYAIYNILNPFFYLHQLTDATDQFNKLARFTWPFFWVFGIWMMYTLVHIHIVAKPAIKYGIGTALVILGFFEVKDQAYILKHKIVADNPLLPHHMQQLQQAHINYSQYQAILPIPFYHSGSEQEKLTLVPYDEWATNTYQLSVLGNLPLMSSLMARTDSAQAASLLHMAAYSNIDPKLAMHLDDRPILIAYNKALATSTGNIPADSTAQQLYMQALQLPQRNQLQPIDSAGDIIFYTWFPKN